MTRATAFSGTDLSGRYAKRETVNPDTLVTRQLAAAMHNRVNRLRSVRIRLRREQCRLLGRPLPELPVTSDLYGDALASWTLTKVLSNRLRPVPSFGFGLAPVVTQAAAARRQRRCRGSLLAAAVVLAAVAYPEGAAVTAVAALALQLGAGSRARAVLRRTVGSVLSIIMLLLLLLVLCWLATTRLPLLHEAAAELLGFTVLFALLVSVVYCADRWVAAFRQQRVVRPDGPLPARPKLAPRASRRTADCETAESWQTMGYRRDGFTDHFVGAGEYTWPTAVTRVQLFASEQEDQSEDGGDAEGKPAAFDANPARNDPGIPGSARAYKIFEADELLDKVRDALQKLKGELAETHALPNCDVAEVLGVSERRWQELPRSGPKQEREQWPEAEELRDSTRESPTSQHSRRYLQAQVVSWDGQLVVTVLAHAALEGRTLHFVARPHVLGPLDETTAAEPLHGWQLLGSFLAAPVQAVCDALVLAVRSYKLLGWLLRLLTPPVATSSIEAQPTDPKLPLSLREHCSPDPLSDLHQLEDARRHVNILETLMFKTVTEFLSEHGMDVEEFRRQAIQIITNHISGDFAQVNNGKVDSMTHNGAPGRPADAPQAGQPPHGKGQ